MTLHVSYMARYDSGWVGPHMYSPVVRLNPHLTLASFDHTTPTLSVKLAQDQPMVWLPATQSAGAFQFFWNSNCPGEPTGGGSGAVTVSFPSGGIAKPHTLTSVRFTDEPTTLPSVQLIARMLPGRPLGIVMFHAYARLAAVVRVPLADVAEALYVEGVGL